MPSLKQIVRMLEEQRRELLDQLDAINGAIAALGSAESHAPDAHSADADVPSGQPERTVLPRQVRAKRILSESHRQALIVGKRKARQAQDVAKGLAREMPDDSFMPAIGPRADGQPPRLVRRAIKKTIG